MKIEVISGMTRLTADEGKKLVRDDSSGTEVWLAEGDTADTWQEVDAETDDIDLLLDELEAEL